MTRARDVSLAAAHPPLPATARSVLLTGALVAGPLFLVVLGACSSSTTDSPTGGGPAEADASATEPPKDHPPPATGERDGSAPALPCETSATCDDPQHDVCDPATAKCIDAQCGALSGKQCPKSQICVYQTAGGVAGVCSDPCAPFGAACSGNRECQIGSMDGATGFCKAHGQGAADAPCTISDITTSCAPGYVCVADPTSYACREQCDFFGAKHACANPGTRCVPPGFCIGETPDPAKAGEPCAASSAAGKPCGDSNGRDVGICVAGASGGALVCSPWCRMSGSDCAAGQTCRPTGSPSVGYCQ